jgi:hypothetical protein
VGLRDRAIVGILIYTAARAGAVEELDAPKDLAKEVWKNWREPQYEPVPIYRATASLGRMFHTVA